VIEADELRLQRLRADDPDKKTEEIQPAISVPMFEPPNILSQEPEDIEN
jgi:hypothetical protein